MLTLPTTLPGASADGFDFAKLFNASDVDLLDPELSAFSTGSLDSLAAGSTAAADVMEVPRSSSTATTAFGSPSLSSLTGSTSPLFMPTSPPTQSIAPGLITPETIAAMNMHTLGLGLPLPPLNPLQLFAAATGGVNFGALAAAALGAALSPTTSLPPLLSATPGSPTGSPSSPSGLSTPTGGPSGIPQAPVFGLEQASTAAFSPSALSPFSASPVGSLSSPSSGFTSRAVSVPGSPEPVDLTLTARHSMSSDVFHATVPATRPKNKKKRRPKPRMSELSDAQAQAKRDANRESARKSRERKRERERSVQGEKCRLAEESDLLRAELAAERAKNEILSKLLMEKETYIVGLHKRLRIEPLAADSISLSSP